MSSGGKENREQEISNISRSKKKLQRIRCSNYIISVTIVETKGGDKRPMLSDLRDSGAIEQDIVCFI